MVHEEHLPVWLTFEQAVARGKDCDDCIGRQEMEGERERLKRLVQSAILAGRSDLI
jgi:hypothetical protein